jgi:hypothetical protein
MAVGLICPKRNPATGQPIVFLAVTGKDYTSPPNLCSAQTFHACRQRGEEPQMEPEQGRELLILPVAVHRVANTCFSEEQAQAMIDLINGELKARGKQYTRSKKGGWMTYPVVVSSDRFRHHNLDGAMAVSQIARHAAHSG